MCAFSHPRLLSKLTVISDLIAWMLQNVDYNPYHAQISRYDLGDLDVKNWFNQEYPGFNWNNSDATVAHFSPATSIFEDFELFLHIVEFFSGQHIGVVKITIPEGFIDACDPVNYETNLKIMVRAHATTRAIQAGFERRAGPIYAVVPENPHDVAAHIFTDAIEAEYRNHAKVWTRSGTASDKDIWKQCQLADLRSEEMMLAPSGRLSWKDKYFAENICGRSILHWLIKISANAIRKSH